MKHPASFALFSSMILVAACGQAQSSDATTDDQATAIATAAPAPEKATASYTISDSVFGIVIARARENCLQTIANLTPGREIKVLLFDRGVAVPAKVGNQHAACGDGMSSNHRAYLLDTYELVPGDFGIALLAPDVQVTNNETDIDHDGVSEFYRVCTSTDGVHTTAWNGHWTQNQRIWHDYYYLGYDLIATCDERETAGS